MTLNQEPEPELLLQENHLEDDTWTTSDKLRSFCSEAINEFTLRFGAVLDNNISDSHDSALVDMYASIGMLDWGLSALKKEAVTDINLIDFAAYSWDCDSNNVQHLCLDDFEDTVFAAVADVKAVEIGMSGFASRLITALDHIVNEYQQAYQNAVRSVDHDDCIDTLLITRDTIEFAIMYLSARSILKDFPFTIDFSMHQQTVRLADLKLRFTLAELQKKFEYVDLPITSPELFWWRKMTVKSYR